MKPGGWLCIDESMFSWLGRALKLPGWKVIKRKPHPIGLESKAAACSLTGMLIDFEFQEGRDVMGRFEFVNQHNKSTARLLRLTKHWHNKEKRTAVADAAFAQVRAAVAPITFLTERVPYQLFWCQYSLHFGKRVLALQ